MPVNGDRAVKCSDGVYRTEQDSVSEAVRFLFADDEGRELANVESCRMERNGSWGDAWANRYTEESFRDALVNPPKSILDAVDAMRAELVETVTLPQSSRRRVRRGQEFGEEMNADAFLNREPNCWDRNTRIKVEKRTVTIGVNVGINASQTPETLLWRGAAAAALADVLTSEGVNVGITAFICRTGITRVAHLGTDKLMVKSPTMPLDLGAVSFAISEAAFTRFCAAYGYSKKYPGILEPGKGSCGMLFDGDKAGLDFQIDFNVQSRESAVEWLRKAVHTTESEVAHA
jgi:hypothetical protein